MPLNQLDERIFATSRVAQVAVKINGELIASGLGAEANLLGIEISYDIDQLPPTATLSMVNIPSWVQRGQDVYIHAGYDGRMERIFTGRVKRRRHAPQGDTIDCVGRTAVLTQPFRSPLSPKSFPATTTAVAAIEDILDDLANPPFANIDPILKNDGTNFEIATVKSVFLDSAPASDMIRQIADVYGYRIYETRGGVLRIRPPLEAPQPSGFRTYGTQGTSEIANTVISFDDSNIDSAVAMGNIAANTRRAQQFTPTDAGSVVRASFWMRKVGAPTDSLRFVIEVDDFVFNPNQPLGIVWASAPLFPGQVLSVGTYIRVDVLITNAVPWVVGLPFHLIVDRTGVLDAVNYYEIGFFSGIGTSHDANPNAWPTPEDPWAGGAAGARDTSIYITDNAANDFGNTNIGAETFDVSAQQQDARSVVLPAGTFTSITAYGVLNTFTRDARFALYDDNAGVPGNLLAYTDSFIVNTTAQFWSANIAFDAAGGAITEIVLGAGTYWITIFSRGGGGFTFSWNFDEGGFAPGIANVFDGTTWSAAGGDHTFEIATVGLPTLRLVNIADDEDEDQVKKEAIVNGATVPSTTAETIDDPGGDETQTQITANRHTDDNSLVNGDFRLYSMVYQNELIQDVVVADEVAQRLVNKYHRILDNIEIEVSFDPRISLGQTITIEDKEPVPDVLPREVTGLDGNWWIRAYRHSLSASGVSTSVSLFGGDQSGTDSEANPEPDFIFQIERELIGNAIQAIVTFISTSIDMDGEIVNYHWVDDYAGGVNDVQGGEDFREVTFAYDPSVDSEINMTLTVTDEDGNTASITIAIDVSTGNNEVFTPVIAVAAGNTCMATFDGALTWIDIATPDGDARVAEVTHDNNQDNPMILFFGTTTGRIYRSQDDLATLDLVSARGAANPIVDIVADKSIRRRIWAVTSTGQVLRSEDRGLTFSLHHDLGEFWSHRHDAIPHAVWNDASHVDPRPISGIKLSPPSVGKIWVFGGIGTDPESWVHNNQISDPVHWFSEIANTAHGDAEASSVASSTGASSDTVVDIERSNDASGDLGLQFSGRNPPFMYAANYLPPESAAWRDGGLLPATDGRGLEGNNGQTRKFGMLLDDRSFYRFVPFEGGGQSLNLWAVFTDVLPGTAANRPNDLLNLSRWSDIYLSATDEGVAKSIDFGETWDFLRPQGAPINTTWPVGAIGHSVAVEYRRPRSFDLLAIVSSNSADPTVENAVAARTGAGGWTDQGPLPTGRSTFPHRLYHWPQIDDQTLFYIRYTSANTDHNEDLFRSPDLGASWENNFTHVGDIARAASGRLWASREPDADPTGHDTNNRYPHALYFSDNNGDTWTLSHNDLRNSGGSHISYFSIAVDPTNDSRVMAVGRLIVSNIRVLVTEDAHLGAAATWAEVSPTPAAQMVIDGIASRYHQPLVVAGDSGRWIMAFQTASVNEMVIWTSDNNGVDWTRRDQVITSSTTEGYSDLIRSGNYFLAMGSMISGTNAQHRRSDDNGRTWQALTTLVNADTHVWDSRVDMITAGRGQLIDYMQPPEVGQVWHPGLEVGMQAAMGYTLPMSIRENGLAIQGV